MGFLMLTLGAKNGEGLTRSGDDKRERLDIGCCAKFPFVIHADHREIAHAPEARHQLVFQFEDHGIRRMLRGHTLSHTTYDFVAGTAFHQVFSHACCGRRTRFAVAVKTGANDGRIAESPALFHEQTAGGRGDAH
ncbi:hypothetical protein D3C80_1642720 [compost metagenome]